MTNVGANQLAIDGGTPVRTAPLPWELPGAHWIGAEERELVDRVIDARSPFRFYGPDLQHMVDTLEAEWRTRCGRRYALGVSSGTAALQIALGAMGIGPGDEVLVPGYMWVSCIAAIVRQGAIPRLVDIDDTFCADPDDVASCIGPRTKCLLYINMSGAPGEVKKLRELCTERGIHLLEDCAQANGASLDGTPAGGFGDIAIFSLQLNKNMTSGEGGVLVCDDEELYKRATAIHDLGYARNESGRLDLTDERYQLWGIGARMSELAGALALAQLRKLDAITAAMRDAKWKIRREIEDIPNLGFRRILDPKGDSGPFLITTYPTAALCERFTAALSAEGIRGPKGSLACIPMKQWGMHWYFNVPSLVNRTSLSSDGFPWSHPANAFASDYDYHRGALPVADDHHDRSAILAIASTLGETDVADIVTAFHKVARFVLNA